VDIIHAAEKYFLRDLTKFCEAHLIYYHEEDDDRLDQLFYADRYQLKQLKAVCIASLSTNFAGIDNVENIGNDVGLLLELNNATAKRQVETKEIVVYKCKKGKNQ